jgi:cation-transporting ATPase E
MASGAQAASQVAQLVLIESDFAAMPAIVGEGRRVINNIQRAASLFLVKNILSSGLALACLIAGFAYPFIPLHLTLISALTIGLPSFLWCNLPAMRRRRKEQGISYYAFYTERWADVLGLGEERT